MSGSTSIKVDGLANGAGGGNQKEGDKVAAELGLVPSNHEDFQVQENIGALDYLYLDMVSPPFQACRDNMRILSSIKPQNSQSVLHSVISSSKVIRNEIDGPNDETKRQSESSFTLSSNRKIELAAENFIRSKYESSEDLSEVSHTLASTLSGLSTYDSKDVQLVQDLLSCADKVCNQQFDCASKLLEECSEQSLSRMNVIQRLVYYFADALREKIERLTGRITVKVEVHNLPPYPITKITDVAAIYQKLPLSQVIQFPGIQTVAEHVSKCRKVNIVDLNICSGVQLMILLQTLAARSDCPLQHVKITALAINSDPLTEEAGARLRSLALSLNLKFSFHVIGLEYLLDHQQNSLDLDPEETVVVSAAFALRHMIADQNRLEALMRAIRSINPSLMIIAETEANVNSPVFVNRFVEALFFFGAYFDYAEDCLENEAERASLESGFLSPAIRNVVAAEGEERKYRIVGISIWKAFFSRFGMVEAELDKLAHTHAYSVLDKFDCRDSCSLCMTGKCLVVSWKDTPMCSLSAWKFQEM